MPSIVAIEGIGQKRATMLRKNGIRTTEALLKLGATKRGRKELSAATRLDEKLIMEWINRADLMRCKGVGSEYSDLLEAAGVDTVKELRRRNPASLTSKMIELNEKTRLVRRLPTESMVTGWIEHANQLEPVVSY